MKNKPQVKASFNLKLVNQVVVCIWKFIGPYLLVLELMDSFTVGDLFAMLIDPHIGF